MLSLDLTAETLAEAAGVESAHATRGDLANRCHTIRRRLQTFSIADLCPELWFLFRDSTPRELMVERFEL